MSPKCLLNRPPRLLAHHEARGARHSPLYLRVSRDDIVGSSYRATRHVIVFKPVPHKPKCACICRWFSESDWCRLFLVEFENEPGLDQGGVRREWFELLCRNAIQKSQQTLLETSSNPQLVPNHVRSKIYL